MTLGSDEPTVNTAEGDGKDMALAVPPKAAWRRAFSPEVSSLDY